MLFDNSFQALYFMLAVCWYISIPLGIALIYFGIRFFRRTDLLGFKIGAVVILLIGLPLIWGGMMGLSQFVKHKKESHRIAKINEAHTWTIEDSVKIAGIQLAPGTSIHFDNYVDMTRKREATLDDISSFDLSAPTEIFGITVVRRFVIINDGWETYLPYDQKIGDWPIKKGRVQLTKKGNLKSGFLAKDYELFGHKFQAGSLVSLWEVYSPHLYYIGTPKSGSFLVNLKTGKIEEP